MELIKCYWLEPTGEVEVSLRRYVGHEAAHRTCPSSGMGYHNVSRILTRGAKTQFPDYSGDWLDHGDRGWPRQCICGYVFQEHDQWQATPETLYRRSDTGELVTDYQAPPGAMRHAYWLESWTGYTTGPDGVILQVKLPDGAWWCVDGPPYRDGVRGEGKWTRTGAIPDVTAMPSIDTGTYHGWLAAGYLRKC